MRSQDQSVGFNNGCAHAPRSQLLQFRCQPMDAKPLDARSLSQTPRCPPRCWPARCSGLRPRCAG
jgi:hypothetical protein